AVDQGFDCYALSFNYGQRSQSELISAKKVAELFHVVEHKILDFDLGMFGGSALTDTAIDVPENPTSGIPLTYVPARNTIFLSLALGWAEVLGSRHIFVGVNAVDYSGYPDCRPEYIRAFERMANLATRSAVEGLRLHIDAPLIKMSKAEIILKGTELGVDYAMTLSCYQANDEGEACGRCDSCRLRKKGFEDAGIVDPTIYSQSG
ncbi:MAG TPA: 7-cyano-7-deazaguanine synthase QueC, partial [Aeromonadales bacterium]|nr:7-cyano-7-deazaguanine synthase QueC [Aeromonadales bacterium]